MSRSEDRTSNRPEQRSRRAGPRTAPGRSPAEGRAVTARHRSSLVLQEVQSYAEGAQQAGSDKTAIHPFHVDVPEAELTDLRRRINAAKWPERETVTDDSQGVPLAMMQELARYWAADYDWRKCEAKLNTLPQFMTEIDG